MRSWELKCCVIFSAHLGLTATLPPVQFTNSSPIHLLEANMTNFGAIIDRRFQLETRSTNLVNLKASDFLANDVNFMGYTSLNPFTERIENPKDLLISNSQMLSSRPKLRTENGLKFAFSFEAFILAPEK